MGIVNRRASRTRDGAGGYKKVQVSEVRKESQKGSEGSVVKNQLKNCEPHEMKEKERFEMICGEDAKNQHKNCRNNRTNQDKSGQN